MPFSHAREPLNSFTHFIGAVLSAIGTFALVCAAVRAPDASLQAVAGAAVFGMSLVALYGASALYHYANCSAKALVRLRKLDHAMIFVLIAGTYTPLFLYFSPARGPALTAVVWGVVVVGIFMKIFWIGAPRWLSTLFYVAMGWALVLDPAMVRALPTGCIALLLAGGLCYSVGAVIYWLKKPNWFKNVGFHELFHIFVLAGSALHFLTIYLYAI